MEQMSLKYAKLLLGFVVLMAILTFFAKYTISEALEPEITEQQAEQISQALKKQQEQKQAELQQTQNQNHYEVQVEEQNPRQEQNLQQEQASQSEQTPLEEPPSSNPPIEAENIQE